MRLLIPATLLVALLGCMAKPKPGEVPSASPQMDTIWFQWKNMLTTPVLTNLSPQVRSFIERKEQLARTLAKKLGGEPDLPTLEYFALARDGEFKVASRIFHNLAERGSIVNSPRRDLNVSMLLWDPVHEAQLALEPYAISGGKFADGFGEGIVRSIPRGSIYFAGNQAGRGLAAAFSKPSAEGDPFFIVSQNALQDARHVAYLRAVYGDKAYMPSDEDSKQCYETYIADARNRYEHDQKSPSEPRQLKPGEDFKAINGKLEIAGHVAFMMVNGLIAKVIFDKNPERDFYVAESFPLDWMYPHLTPHSLIMKINRQRIVELTPDIIARDHEFWRQRQVEFIGGWLESNTPVGEVCQFVEKAFLRKDLAGFKGDREFVRNDFATAAYAFLRNAQAGLYTWRFSRARSQEDRQRMAREADFAFRQSFAFCPTGQVIIFGYVNLLILSGRLDDALLVARTGQKLNPSEGQVEAVMHELERMKNASDRK